MLAAVPRSLDEFAVDFQRPLGAGACGAVYSGRHRASGRDVAIKVVSPALPAAVESDSTLGAEQERRAFEHVLHAGECNPHVVGLVGCFEGQCSEAARLGLAVPEEAAEEPVHYFVMERLGAQSLADRIKLEEGLDELEAKEVTRALCDGLAFLHGQGIAHRDVKPSNALYPPNASHSELKLIDFSHSGVVPEQEEPGTAWFDKKLGTAGYVAPEVLSEREPYSTKCDVYSLGCTVHAMVTNGRLPRRHARAGIVTALPSSASRELDDFLGAVLCPDPEQRPSISEVLKDPWLQ